MDSLDNFEDLFSSVHDMLFSSSDKLNSEGYKTLPRLYINRHLVAGEWHEARTSLLTLLKAPFADNLDIMTELFGQIEVPQQFWTELKAVDPSSYTTVHMLKIIEAVVENGDIVTIRKCLNYDGIPTLVKMYKKALRFDVKSLCLNTISSIVTKTGDMAFIMEVVPIFPCLIKKVNVDLIYSRAALTYEVCERATPDLLKEILSFGVTDFAVEVIQAGHKIKELTDLKTIYWTLASLEKVMRKVVSLNIKDDGFLRLTPHIVNALKQALLNQASTPSSIDLQCLTATAINFLVFIIIRGEPSDLKSYKALEVVPTIVNSIKSLEQQNTGKSLYYSSVVIHNTVLALDKMALHTAYDLHSMSLILPLVEKKFLANPTFDDFCSISFSLCTRMVNQAEKQEVEYMVKNGIVSLLTKLFDVNKSSETIIELVSTVYKIILNVGDCTGFSHLQHHIRSVYSLWNQWQCQSADDFQDLNKSACMAYVIVACSGSLEGNGRILQILCSFFEMLFNKIQNNAKQLKRPQPCSFLIQKMMKLKNYQSIVLQHVWFVAYTGNQISELFSAIPESDKLGNLSSKNQQLEILKFVLTQTKIIIESKEKYNVSVLVQITDFLTKIPCNDQEDDVLYHLEDLVSPCLGLLENQNNKVIIDNVKKYINNLHYS